MYNTYIHIYQGRIQEIAQGGHSESPPPWMGPYLPKILSPDFEKLLGFRPIYFEGPPIRFFLMGSRPTGLGAIAPSAPPPLGSAPVTYHR